MPSRPPETSFYNDAENELLWRDMSRLYEQFLGPDSEKWSGREERFVTVLNDVHVKLRELPRRACIHDSSQGRVNGETKWMTETDR